MSNFKLNVIQVGAQLVFDMGYVPKRFKATLFQFPFSFLKASFIYDIISICLGIEFYT